MLLHGANTGELSDESDDGNEHVADSDAMPEDKLCKACQMYVNGPTQWKEHRRCKKHIKKQEAMDKKDGEQLKKDGKQMSNPPTSDWIAAEMQPEDCEGIKGLAGVESSSKATSSKASAAAVPNSSSAASSDPASQRRTYPSAASEDWASSPQQGGEDSRRIDGQHAHPYVLCPAGWYPEEDNEKARCVTDRQYSWEARPYHEYLTSRPW